MANSETGSDNDNRDPEIVAVLIHISKKTRAILGLRLAEIGLATGEDDILLALKPEATSTVERISSDLAVRSPTIRRAVERLAARGLIEQITSSIVRLTDEGVSMQPRVAGVHKRIANDIARTVDVSKFTTLTAELKELDGSLGVALRQMT